MNIEFHIARKRKKNVLKNNQVTNLHGRRIEFYTITIVTGTVTKTHKKIQIIDQMHIYKSYHEPLIDLS